MSKLACMLSSLLLLLAPTFSDGQKIDALNGSRPVILPIQLLPGYKVEGGHGTDTAGARIFKDGETSIAFGLGIHMAVQADSVDETRVAWKEDQIVNGRHLTCVYTKSGELIASFRDLPVANFSAKIRTQQELAEMLLMVLTFEPSHGYPVESSAMAHQHRSNSR
jgi:hypothetical protein